MIHEPTGLDVKEERAAHRAWMDSGLNGMTEPYEAYVQGWRARAALVKPLPVEAIEAGISGIETEDGEDWAYGVPPTNLTGDGHAMAARKEREHVRKANIAALRALIEGAKPNGQ